MFKLKFSTDDAMFGKSYEELKLEVSRILREIAGKIEEGRTGGSIISTEPYVHVIGQWDLK